MGPPISSWVKPGHGWSTCVIDIVNRVALSKLALDLRTESMGDIGVVKKKHKTSGVLFVRVEQKMLDELDAEAERLSAQAGGLATFDRSTVVRGILVAALAGKAPTT